MEPPRTILNAISENGLAVIGVGKISDIFAGQGITESFPTDGNAEGMQRIAEQWPIGGPDQFRDLLWDPRHRRLLLRLFD